MVTILKFKDIKLTQILKHYYMSIFNFWQFWYYHPSHCNFVVTGDSSVKRRLKFQLLLLLCGTTSAPRHENSRVMTQVMQLPRGNSPGSLPLGGQQLQYFHPNQKGTITQVAWTITTYFAPFTPENLTLYRSLAFHNWR